MEPEYHRSIEPAPLVLEGPRKLPDIVGDGVPLLVGLLSVLSALPPVGLAPFGPPLAAPPTPPALPESASPLLPLDPATPPTAPPFVDPPEPLLPLPPELEPATPPTPPDGDPLEAGAHALPVAA